MDLGIAGKRAFIGGSSAGLGKAVAMEFAREGVHVAICGRNKTRVEATQLEIQQETGVEVLALSGDLSISADRQYIGALVKAAWGGIDILVTNTGGPPAGRFEDFSLQDWQAAYELLLASTVEMIQLFLPGMKQKQWGRILAISSVAVKEPVSQLILSNSVRGSLLGLLKTLSQELGSYNITVNNILPGYTETQRLKNLLEQNPGIAEVKNEIALGRFGQPQEFAAAVAFLASNRASYINGVSLAVDGGLIKGI